jgi:cell fate regulator YaaT (PSP1 superfamily)
MWQGYDINDMPDMDDAINFQTKVVRNVKMDTYKKFCVEQVGNNETPCKYLYGDDIFTKMG